WSVTAYAPRQAHYARDPWAWSAPAPHRWGYAWSHDDWEVQNFWHGYQPVMLRMPLPEGTQDRWCLTVRYTTCSIPTYEACRFAASPQSGYCFPNPNYAGGRRSLAYMAHASRHRHGGHMVVAAHAGGAGLKVAAHRAAAKASVGVDPAADGALTEIIARSKDIDGAYGAFAMADDTSAAIAATAKGIVPSNPAVAAPSAGQPVKVASLAPETGIGIATIAPATPAPAVVPRKGAAAGGVPTINVTPSCRAAANAIVGGKQDVDLCLKSEMSARD